MFIKPINLVILMVGVGRWGQGRELRVCKDMIAQVRKEGHPTCHQCTDRDTDFAMCGCKSKVGPVQFDTYRIDTRDSDTCRQCRARACRPQKVIVMGRYMFILQPCAMCKTSRRLRASTPMGIAGGILGGRRAGGG